MIACNLLGKFTVTTNRPFATICVSSGEDQGADMDCSNDKHTSDTGEQLRVDLLLQAHVDESLWWPCASNRQQLEPESEPPGLRILPPVHRDLLPPPLMELSPSLPPTHTPVSSTSSAAPTPPPGLYILLIAELSLTHYNL
ncbi:hypothetical protein GW17_00010896 [Ensete ventricosum]|nr:hypothetical protein GW17_00010896 [Ensete ventricosum]